MHICTQIAMHFLKKPGSHFPSFTALVSVLGVSVGVAAFIVVVTVFNSFEAQLRSTLLGANPNLVVHNFPNDIPNAREAMAEVQGLLSESAKALSLFEYNEVLLSRAGSTATVIIKGIEGTRAASSVDMRQFVKPAEALGQLDSDFSGARQLENGLPPIILGRGLAHKLNAQLGDVVSLSSGTFGLGQRHAFQDFGVAGILAIGLAQYDEKLALISFERGVELFGQKGHAKGIEIALKDPLQAEVIAERLDSLLPYQMRPWQEIDRGLFRQIERDGQAVRLIVLIITLVAAFNIIVTLSMSVIDRSKQIATLRSLGARRWDIIRVFVLIGGALGAMGAGLGVVIAFVVLEIFSGFDLGELKEFYFVDRIPVDYDVTLMGLAFVSAILLSFLSALYPAWKATKVSPLYGLKPWT